MSVEPLCEPLFIDDGLVGQLDPLHVDGQHANMLQDHTYGNLDDISFTHGTFDSSFDESLDFSFDDFINDNPASLAVDGLGAA